MKCIGIPQPGAWLVINGYYTTIPLPEMTQYRGSVLVYALPEPVNSAAFEQFKEGCRQLRITSYPSAKDFELGGFLGRADLVDCELTAAGHPLAEVENADELGFIASDGGLGVFEVEADPFVVPDLPRVSYQAYAFSPPSSRSQTAQRPPHAADDPSSAGHFLEGFEKQVKRELNKNLNHLGRAVAKDAITYGADALMSWLGGGGKPKGGGGKKRK